MLKTYLRRVFLGATLCVLGGAIAGGLACSSAPRKIPVVSTGAAGTTGTGTGTAGTSATGAAGDTSAAGTTGATGAAGDTSAAGMTGAAGTTTAGTAGAAGGAAGDTSAAGTNGAAGAAVTGAAGTTAPPPDNSIKLTTFPIAVTMYWYPSGWDGDPATVAAFAATPAPIKIEDQSAATTGPCSKRVTGHIGSCFKVTYTPVAQADGGAPGHASVALIPNIPQSANPNFGDATMAPHVPTGATTISAEVAGDAGGEQVQFNLWDANSADLFSPTFVAGQAWQKISTMVPAGYDQELSPFGWGSMSTTPIVFYYDDVRINNN